MLSEPVSRRKRYLQVKANLVCPIALPHYAAEEITASAVTSISSFFIILYSKMSSSDESSTEQAIPPSSAIPSKERYTARVIGRRGLREFLVVDHTANQRKNSKISLIWEHGGERRRLDDKSMARYWRCAYCKGSATVLKVDGNEGQTTHAWAHLKNRHQIDCNPDNSAIPTGIASLQATVAAGAAAITTVASKTAREAYGLVTMFDAASFRRSLIQFIVMCSIAFSVVESPYFQALLMSCLHALTPIFCQSRQYREKMDLGGIREATTTVIAELVTAQSRIHVSFNLWTSPNGLALVGGVVHYLDKYFVNRSYLIAMRRVRGAHSGEN